MQHDLDLLDPVQVCEQVEWPQVSPLTEEMTRLRRRLVYIFVDRFNRKGATEENEKELTAVMANIRDFYNPSGYLGVVRFNTVSKKKMGHYDTPDFSIKKNGSPRKEQQAVFSAISKMTNLKLKSVADFY